MHSFDINKTYFEIDRLNLSSYENRFDELENGQENSQTALELNMQLSQGDRYKKGLVDSLNNLTWYELRLTSYKKAEEFAEQALNLAREIGYFGGEARSLGHLGRILMYWGHYAEALETHQKQLEISNRFDLETEKSTALSYMGHIYARLGKPEEAIESYKASAKIDEKLGDTATLSGKLINIGLVYSQFEEIENSLSYSLEGLELAKETGNFYSQCWALGSIAKAYRKKGRFEESIKYLEEKYALSIEINDEQQQLDALIEFGKTYLASENFRHSIDFLTKGIEVAQKNNFRPHLIRCYETIAQAYEGAQDHKKSLEFYKLFHDLKEEIFNKSVDQRPKDNTFVFYEGPPSANGKPGIHHVMGRTVKDLFCRYQTMKGKRVERKGGWDTHGLPVELSVEKELGITKEDIGKTISIKEYNQKCRETVMRFKDMWDDITRKMGYWVDLDDPYITFKNEYIESVWWLLKNLYSKNLLYKGYTIQPYSPAAGTGLSSHELNQPGCYRDVKDTSAVAQFKVIKNDKSDFLFEGKYDGDVFIIAWTTTPWTLPSNTALAMGKKITYVRVATYNPYTKLPVNLILAKDLLSKWFKEEQYEAEYNSYNPEDKIIPVVLNGEWVGTDFEMIEYEQLLPYQQPEEGDAFKVLIGDFVSTEDGTGIVHLAPSFGADDMRTATKYGIGALTLVDKQGKFVDGVGEFSGRYVKDYKDEPEYRSVDIDISIKLKQENKAFNVQKYSHNYPHCWRTDKPVLYYPLDSWFIKASAAKERMKELNDTINWKPAHTGEKRFGNWLENLQDWNLSRSRYWGIPLPIWRTEDAEEELCIGSIEELTNEINKANSVLGLNQSIPDDLHRPHIDDVILVSSSGKKMTRELDLIDVWFDSGSMPYAQLHYPFENKELVDSNSQFPADFIAEGVDQTRGWFYTLHAIASMCFDSVAYKNVVSNGLVLDKNGVKMSKRLGNVIDPFETLKNYGADATRWYMISNAPPWDNLKFSLEGVDEVRRKFFGTLYNTYSFFALYANIDGFNHSEEYIPLSERPEIDRWIISLLNSLKKDVDSEYSNYEPTNATRRIQEFVDEYLSNWYVRLCRRRFWKGELGPDKIAAYQTLYECLVAVAKMMAPVAPFFSDWLFRNLNSVTMFEDCQSVHLAIFPTITESAIDNKLEERMEYAKRISSLVLSLRRKDKLRVRQPLQKIMLPVLNPSFQNQVEQVQELILSEVNVKEIDFITESDGIIKKKIKPNFKTLGKKLGKHMKSASQVIQGLNQEDIGRIEHNGNYTLKLDGEEFLLTLEDFEITSEDIPGWQVATDRGITVALDVTLTDDLKAEGMAREIVNRIQNLRKSSDFNVTDRINIQLEEHHMLTSAIDKYGEYIKAETLADSIELRSELEGEKTDLVDQVSVVINIDKV